jgi:hypothetical protein
MDARAAVAAKVVLEREREIYGLAGRGWVETPVGSQP